MNKQDLIDQLAKTTDIAGIEARVIVELFFNEMSCALSRDERVEIRGLCSFSVKKYKPYSGRNPKTGARVKVKAKKLPFFKAGKELRDRVSRAKNAKPQ